MANFEHLCPAQDPADDFCKTCAGEGRVSDCCGAPLKTVPGEPDVYCDACGIELDMYFTTECKQCQGSGANCE